MSNPVYPPRAQRLIKAGSKKSRLGNRMKLQRFRSSRSIQIGIIEMLDPSGKEFRYFPRQREGKGARGEGKMHGNLVKYQRSSTLEATRAFRSSHLCVESDILRLFRVSTKAIIKMNIYLFSGVNDNLIRNNNKDSRSVELAIIGSRESRVHPRVLRGQTKCRN